MERIRRNILLGIEQGNRSQGYVEAATRLGVPYKLIDCNKNDVIEQLREVDAFIWHYTQDLPREMRIYHGIMKSAEVMGKAIYPDMNTGWMFNDKAYEKYLLEAVGAPLVPTYLFFTAQEAKAFLAGATYPLVYKLPGGAGSTNVRLVHSEEEGNEIVNQAFYELADTEIERKVDALREKKYDLRDIYAGIYNSKGMVLFQEFLPDNTYDIRVTTVGEKAYIYDRLVRDNDFRASGSGKLNYEPSEKDKKAIPIAQELSKKLGVQTMTYDFLYALDGALKISEMSYGFVEKPIHDEKGWYDEQMIFHEEPNNVFEDVVLMLVDKLEARNR